LFYRLLAGPLVLALAVRPVPLQVQVAQQHSDQAARQRLPSFPAHSKRAWGMKVRVP
jgi:hypothetical protein